MLPFWVLGLASQLRQEKWEIFQLFFLSSPVAGKHNCQNVEIKFKHKSGEGGRNSGRRKNDKELVNYAL